MRIVQTPARFHPAIGGVEKYVLELSAQLAKHHHRVTIVCANEPASNVQSVRGIQVLRLPSLLKIANTNITLPLIWTLMRLDFDLIHTHMPTPWSCEISVICSKIKRKPCVLTYHNDVEKTGVLGGLTRVYNATILRLVLASVDKILITQTRYVRDSRYLAPFKEKIEVISNGVATLPPAAVEPHRDHTVLFVSVLDRYHRYKGLDDLIHAVSLLRAEWPDIRLDVIGAGELVAEYVALTKSLDLDRYICFHGYVDDERLQEYYRKSAAFVLPSIDSHEGFGIVLLEAMSHGTPVITTDAVGLSNELREYQAGSVTPPKNPRALAEAIGWILSHPEQAQEMGRKGRKLIAEKYLWSGIAERLMTIYAELIQ